MNLNMDYDLGYDTDDTPPTTRRRPIQRKPITAGQNVLLTPELEAQGYKVGDWICTKKTSFSIRPGYKIRRDVSPDRDYPKDYDKARMTLKTKKPKNKKEQRVSPSKERPEEQRQEEESVTPVVPQQQEEPTPTIFVRLPDQSRIEIPYVPSDTRDAIRNEIGHVTQLPVQEEEYLVSFRGKQLPHDTPAEQMGIRPGSVLTLVKQPPKPVTVHTYDQRTLEIMVDRNDTLKQIKQQLHQETGLPVDQQLLSLLKDYTTDLPSALNTKQPLPGDDDDTKAQTHGVVGGTHLYLEPQSITATVHTWDDQHFLLEDIDPHDSLGNLREQLAGPTGVEVGNQKITKLLDYDVNNRHNTDDGEELVGDRKSLTNHGIRNGSHLYLEPKLLQVVVEMPDGEEVELHIRPEDTADDLKERVHEQTTMPVAQQVLKFPDTNKELPSNQTVAEMGLRHGDRVRCDRAKIPIVVQTDDEQLQIPLRVDPTTTTIDDIKRLCARPSGIEVSKQTLKPDKDTTEEFRDGSVTLEECGIQANDNLWLSQTKQPPVAPRKTVTEKKQPEQKMEPLPKRKGKKLGQHHGPEGPHLGQGGSSIESNRWYGDWEFQLNPVKQAYVSKTTQIVDE